MNPAPPDFVQAFGELDAGAILLRLWGKNAPTRVARVQVRLNRVRDSLDENGKRWLDFFHRSVPDRVRAGGGPRSVVEAVTMGMQPLISAPVAVLQRGPDFAATPDAAAEIVKAHRRANFRFTFWGAK